MKPKVSVIRPQQFLPGHTPWNKGKKCSSISKALTGKKLSDEHKQKLREAKLKKPNKYWLGKKRPEMVGDKNWKWKGDKVGYFPLHAWVNRSFGKATICEDCESTEHVEWANRTGQYKREREDWLELCAKCHDAFDRKNSWGDATRKYPELRRYHAS